MQARQRFHDAGRHALAAGDDALAQTYAERCLWDLIKQGKLAEAREWLERVPNDALAQDVDLRIASGWIMALGDRPAQALEIASELARDPDASPQVQFEAALVGAAAAVFEDRPGIAAAMLSQWKDPPASFRDPIHAVAHANNLALLALFDGDTDKVRRLEAHLPARLQNKSLLLALSFGRMIVGMSHLWDGNAYKAEAALRPALARRRARCRAPQCRRQHVRADPGGRAVRARPAGRRAGAARQSPRRHRAHDAAGRRAACAPHARLHRDESRRRAARARDPRQPHGARAKRGGCRG